MPPRHAPASPLAATLAASGADAASEARNPAGRDIAARTPEAAASASALPAASHPATRSVAGTEAPRKPASAAQPAAAAVPAVNSTAANAAPPSRPAPQPTPSNPDGARAKALLDAKATSAAEGARFVVQVGAFSEAESARDTRAKAEKLGLKTYTQVAQTPAGNRIRVRIGPFANRAEADAALAKARAGGLTAVVLTL